MTVGLRACIWLGGINRFPMDMLYTCWLCRKQGDRKFLVPWAPPQASVLDFGYLCSCNLCQPAFCCASCMAAAEESLGLLSLDMPSPVWESIFLKVLLQLMMMRDNHTSTLLWARLYLGWVYLETPQGAFIPY